MCYIGRKIITLARFTLVEYISEKVADKFENDYKGICPKALPEADVHILIRTGALCGMLACII